MRYTHVTIACRDHHTWFSDAAARRDAVRRLVRRREALHLFALVDTHGHFVVEGDPVDLTRNLHHTLQAGGGIETEPAKLVGVKDQGHLVSLVSYLVQQTVHHGLDVHPALWSGSCFQDLVGARCLPDFDPGAIRRALPRLREEDLWATASLPVLEPVALVDVGPEELLAAAMAVHAFDGDPTCRQAPMVEARALAVHAARAVGWTPSTVAARLGIDPRTERRLASREVSGKAIHALRLQLAIRRTVPHLPLPTPRRGVARGFQRIERR